MKNLTRYIMNILSFILFLTAASVAQNKWAPIMMSDITTFVPNTASVQANKDYYAPNATVTVDVQGYLSGDKDWVGIYKKGTSTAWANVIAWNWVHAGKNSISKKLKDMPTGEYEARLFYYNNFVMQASDSFAVRKDPISTVKATYTANETVSVNVQMALSGDKDWVGVFKKNDDNSWGNVIKWNWVKKNGTVTLTRGDGLMPAGEYEVRLFYRNEYGADAVARATYGFRVIGGGNNHRYGNFGDYEDEIDIKYQNDNYKRVYYVPGLENAPVVVFITGYRVPLNEYDGLLRFIASHGNYVIAVYEDAAKTSPHWWHPVSKHAANIENLINDAIDNDSADASKLAVIGHSIGGGDAFAIMNYFKNNNRSHSGTVYASNANFVISLDGYFAYDMNAAKMANLNTTTLIMQFGGADGVGPYDGHTYMQDPRINLTIYDRLSDDEKAYSFIAPENHGYLYGNSDSIRKKKNLIEPIDALFDYKFGDGGEYAKNIALVNQYDAVINALPVKNADYAFKCNGIGDGESQCNDY